MIRFALEGVRETPREVLLLGAHSDDIEIGCGGTILRLASTYPRLRVHWVVLSASGEREEEARRSAEAFLAGVAEKRVVVRNFRNGYFPWAGAEIKDFFEEMKGEISPDLIFTHWRDDAHQDHRTVCELTWNTWRDHVILEYEVPKYDGDLGRPNLYVALDEAAATRKIEGLLSAFPTQRQRHWFTEDTFRGILRLRGIEACTRYAEAFHCRKIVL
jgi:LmbE family N-acetylglucosaminyl deacetylase